MEEILELEETVLTTKDNPYDPREDYAKWLEFDHAKGYYTQEHLARLVNIDVEAEGPLVQTLIELAKLDIIDNDMTGMYVLL